MVWIDALRKDRCEVLYSQNEQKINRKHVIEKWKELKFIQVRKNQCYY
ncbi:hypothetical protein SAMN05421800_1484 [Chryseobacterium balustinum]|jgi:hypothetical protein|uniref:Uncharacterized protein n=1 Tax=Chryseobacterium balustinum TaxID=246 RepID=A0AAX2IJ81_9FLAO|nr:hypothetical protein SAMN05421800_1484 [Chryseobacterium balustinum]SQA88755.1 Uncharacterised protein [Chryseobacterium balustinum]